MFWQLVFIGGMSYSDVKNMSFSEGYEAYEAMLMIKKD